MVIRITDPDLLEISGGIVQGMSGSPIIQDGMLVGAVTHVFVNDPTRGYGIFAENMDSTLLTIGRAGRRSEFKTPGHLFRRWPGVSFFESVFIDQNNVGSIQS